jgi:hypothetical protein
MLVFQPNAGICLAIILDAIIWCPEKLWETYVMHVASKRLGPWSLRTETVPFSVIASTLGQDARAVYGLCVLIPLAGLSVCLGSRCLFG